MDDKKKPSEGLGILKEAIKWQVLYSYGYSAYLEISTVFNLGGNREEIGKYTKKDF
jgi:hypothetical protein